MIDKHTALIYPMVLMSVADGNMSDIELERISLVVQYLPVFRDFDLDELPRITEDCIGLLLKDDGIELALRQMKEILSPNMRETAYALACDVAAADGVAKQEELVLLEMMRDELEIERLIAAAIERGSRARHITA